MIGSVLGLFITLKRRSWLAFPIAFALLHLFLVNNMFFNIGATMGERLVYHTSLGTCMLMAFGVYYLFTKGLKKSGALMVVVLLPIIALYSIKTIARNPAWKNDYTLTMTDVQTYPNSIMLNGNACNRLIEMSEFPKNKAVEKKFLDSAAAYGRKALALHPKYVTTYMNMGMIKMKQGDVDSAATYWDNVIRLFPTHPNVPQIRQTLLSGFSNKANEFLKTNRMQDALVLLLKAHAYTPDNPRLCYDIGNMYRSLGNGAKAKEFYNNGLRYAPGDRDIMNALGTVN